MDTRKRVQRSALLLDECAPGWAPRVNVARLDLGSAHWCVLGQVFGSYFDGWRAVEHASDPTFSYAFAPLPGGRAAWTEEILWRRVGEPPPPERELVAV